MSSELRRPYRVVAQLPEAKELNLLGLGLDSKWHKCALTPYNGRVVAAVDELKGTIYKVIHFSFTVSQQYTNPDRCKASVLCTPGGKMMTGRSYERGGVRYISGLRYFVLVTTNCFRTRADAVTEWEVQFVNFDKESENGHSIEVVEQAYFLTMPTNLRARFTLGDRMVNPLLSYEEVLAEITKKVDAITDTDARQKFQTFAPAMAVSYILAFGGEAAMPEREEKQEQKAVAELTVVEEPKAEETEETPEAEEPEEAEIVFAATGTDNAAPIEIDTTIAEQQAAAMSEEKKNKRQRKPRK